MLYLACIFHKYLPTKKVYVYDIQKINANLQKFRRLTYLFIAFGHYKFFRITFFCHMRELVSILVIPNFFLTLRHLTWAVEITVNNFFSSSGYFCWHRNTFNTIHTKLTFLIFFFLFYSQTNIFPVIKGNIVRSRFESHVLEGIFPSKCHLLENASLISSLLLLNM